MPRKQPPSAALRALPAAKEPEDPFRPEGMDSHNLCPNSNPYTNNPDHDADVSTGTHSSLCPQLHPHQPLTAPVDSAKDTTDDKHPFYHTASGPH